MKITLGWLKEHLETDATLDQIAERLTMLGLEVEEVIDRTTELAPFTVALVEAAEQHPNADRLRVCKVNTGSEVLDVVCGAPNARAGMKGVFAPIGSVIPGTGFKLEKKPIRGVTGYGMLCSEREMGLSDNHDSIIELPEDAPLGAAFAEVMGLDDPVIDIALTPDRGDCAGVAGIARDLAAAGLGRVITPVAEPMAGEFDSPIGVRLQFDAETAGACSFFAGRLIRGVTNGPSPAWLQRRLMEIGLRPISALVDITNFITFDRARPLHVFDADAIAGGIHVRLAAADESLDALDDKSYQLDDQMTVVADDDGPVALGGVIGGTPTGCTEETVNVFVEAALFDPTRTAATGRKLGIDSDARYRFERGVDPAGTVPGLEQATAMIQALCGGTASHVVTAGAAGESRKQVNFRPNRVHALGGLDVVADESRQILSDLGFETAIEDGGFKVTVPSWRPDIDGEADLVEEVLRVKGYDSVPPVSMTPTDRAAAPAVSAGQRRVRRARRLLAARGLNECVTWSFLDREIARLFGGGDDALVLDNPISSDLDCMRPSLLPNLIAAAGRNGARGFADVGLFEVGPQYDDDTPEGQLTVAAGIRGGGSGPRHWLRASRPVDAFDVKADAFAVLGAFGAPVDRLMIETPPPDWYHPGRGGLIKLGPKNLLGRFGEIHPGILGKLDVEGPVVGFELFLDRLPAPKAKAGATRPAMAVSDLPAVARDFAFVVDADVAADKVLSAVRAQSGKTHKIPFTEVSLFDIYAGEGIETGKKSIAVNVVLQPFAETLTDAQIQDISDAIVAQVTKSTGGELRG